MRSELPDVIDQSGDLLCITPAPTLARAFHGPDKLVDDDSESFAADRAAPVEPAHDSFDRQSAGVIHSLSPASFALGRMAEPAPESIRGRGGRA